MQFASKALQKKINDCNIKTQGKHIRDPYIYFQNKNKQKYRQCLALIDEWSQDLLERQNNVHKIQQKYIQDCENDKENKQINMNGSCKKDFDLQEILSQEFVKKMQSLYMKQLMLRDFENENMQSKNKSYNTFQEMDSL